MVYEPLATASSGDSPAYNTAYLISGGRNRYVDLNAKRSE